MKAFHYKVTVQGFTKVVITRGDRLQEWLPRELRIYF